MLRSMYSGISGLKNFQTKLDVIGNNIANVNTHGFKKGRVVFKDLISQTQSSASGATTTVGGINSKQVGLGSTIAAIDTIHGGGSIQTTGRGLDFAIEGEGFFMVADASDDFVRYDSKDPTSTETAGTAGVGGTSFTNVLYTRSGNYYMDNDGYLVNADGKYLVGVSPEDSILSTDYPTVPAAGTPTTEDLTPNDDPATPWEVPAASNGAGVYKPIKLPTDAKSFSVGQDGTVTFVDSNGDLRWAGQLVLSKFPNAGGLEKVGNNYYTVTANSGEPYTQAGTVAGMGKIVSGALEMSNVDLSEEFTEMIVAQRGFQANTRIITTSDEILQELVNLKR
ncbi:flagellar hook-basal body complex protein [Lysinibacillus boronitolerans]|uniref:flagellar hook-basal body complex protein n=1 Tax=Lysinibacillus boronitolerans TaxID=309788 RepID=UPI00030EF835|nr:flagellar hook-basal body complex protein [Lysinibacillus boronitolerans]